MPEEVGEGTALRSVRCQALFWSIALLGLALDLWSKHAAFSGLGWPAERFTPSADPACEGEIPPPGPHLEIIPCWFRLQTSLNPGAIWGKFDGAGTILAGFSIAAMLFVVYWFGRCPRSRWASQTALGLIFAGAAGNFYDRVWVRPDFLEFELAAGSGPAVHRKVGRLKEEGRSLRLGETDVPVAEIDRFTVSYPDGHAVLIRTDGRRLEGVVPPDARLLLYPNYDRPVEADLLSVAVRPDTAAGGSTLTGLRVRRKLGAVRDFFDLHYKDKWHYPIFNVADSFLTVGVIILLLATLGEAGEDLARAGSWLRRLFGGHKAEPVGGKPPPDSAGPTPSTRA